MTVEFRVNVDGIDRLIAGLAAAPAALDEAERQAMSRSVFVLEAAVKGRTPRVTGRLFSSIAGEVRMAPLLQGRVSTSVSYGPFVEEGRGPIIAKPGHFLRFRIGGLVIFRRSVGPAAGRHMFREGLAASRDQIKEIFRDSIKRAVALIKGK